MGRLGVQGSEVPEGVVSDPSTVENRTKTSVWAFLLRNPALVTDPAVGDEDTALPSW
jgi:hypothetical protein